MARDKTDKFSGKKTAPANDGPLDTLHWKPVKVAEDEISVLYKSVAQIENRKQAELAFLETQNDNFWPEIEAFADRCDEILAAEGFPRAVQWVRHDPEGNWWNETPLTAKRPAEGVTHHFTRGGILAQKFAADFSDAWYAGKLGIMCRIALAHFQKGDSGKPFLFTMVHQIASLRTDWNWRREYKPPILTGRKQRKHLKDVRENRNRDAKAAVDVRREAIRGLLSETKREGGALTTWLQQQLKSRHHISVSLRTIRDDLKALRG